MSLPAKRVNLLGVERAPKRKIRWYAVRTQYQWSQEYKDRFAQYRRVCDHAAREKYRAFAVYEVL